MIDVPVWPMVSDPRDPWEDDPAYVAAAWKVHRRRDPLGGLTEAAFHQALQAFEEGLRANLGGELAFDALPGLARPLGITDLDELDPRTPETPEVVAEAAEIARIGPDGHPDLGSEAPGRLLGPWEDVVGAKRGLLCACLAEACFLERIRGEGSGWTRFRRRKPLPDVDVRARVRPVRQAPVGVWTLASKVEGGWRIADRTGLAVKWVPQGPVALRDPVSVTDAEPRHGRTLVGRVVKTADGWVVPMPFLVDGEPPVQRIAEEVQRIEWRQRLVFGRVSREEALANAGYALIRRVHEWAWLQSAR